MASMKNKLCVFLLVVFWRDVIVYTSSPAKVIPGLVTGVSFPSNTTAPPAGAGSGGGGSGAGSGGGGSGGGTGGCVLPSCPSCPAGYQVYNETGNLCSQRCVCQLSATTAVPKAPAHSLLLSMLQHIQNNADALELMAKGLSDGANLAQDIADF